MFAMNINKLEQREVCYWETIHNLFTCPYTMKSVHWGKFKDGLWYSSTTKKGHIGCASHVAHKSKG